MKPEQPAARSNAAAPVAPRLFWTMQAVAGIGMSGVTVAQMMRSTSDTATPADSSASRAARVANCDMYSSSVATRRSRIPVREVIQSSDVSTIFSRSALVRTREGRQAPVPRMMALLSARVIDPPHLRLGAGMKLGAGRRHGGHPENLVVDAIVHPVPHEALGPPPRVLDGAHGGPAMADDGRRPDSQERHAAVLGVV